VGWFKRIVSKGGAFVESLFKTPGHLIQPSIDTIRGKKDLGEALQDTVRASINPFRSAGDAVAEVDRLTQELSVSLVKTIGGEKAAVIMADLNYISHAVADPALAVAVLSSVDKFIDTGDMQYLSPLNIYAVREIDQARARMWNAAHEIPPGVIAALPLPVRKLTAKVRWILESEIPGDLHLPAFALRRGSRDAITLENLIVFRIAPGFQSEDDQFLWTHELFHTSQYRSLGIVEFTRRYLANEFGFRPPGAGANPLEVQADLFACRYFPNGHPYYLTGNVCPKS